jgi:hypothetical protein
MAFRLVPVPVVSEIETDSGAAFAPSELELDACPWLAAEPVAEDPSDSVAAALVAEGMLAPS